MIGRVSLYSRTGINGMVGHEQSGTSLDIIRVSNYKLPSVRSSMVYSIRGHISA